MVSTKAVAKNIPEIEAKLKAFGGDMVKIEFLENCLKQLMPNDVKCFCHLKLSESYAYRLMWPLAAKNMGAAAECATTYGDKINFYMKEISLWLKVGDYLMIDKAFKKALLCGNNQEKELIKTKLKAEMLTLATDYEKRNKRSHATQIYERLIEMPITNDAEKKELMGKVASLDAKLGRLKDAIRYEQMMKSPISSRKSSNDPDENARKVSFEDLGIDSI